MIRKNYKLFMPVGMLSLTIALILKTYASQNDFTDFIMGIFIGLSIALNLTFVYREVKLSKNK